MKLGPGIAVAVSRPAATAPISTPSLGTSICFGGGPKQNKDNKKKKKKRIRYLEEWKKASSRTQGEGALEP